MERELQTVLAAVDELAKRPIVSQAAAREVAAALGTQLARVQHLQRRLADINAEEQQCVDRMELRLTALEQMAQVSVSPLPSPHLFPGPQHRAQHASNALPTRALPTRRVAGGRERAQGAAAHPPSDAV